jgi:lipid-binding SYLF domain-containing protein
MKFLVQLLSGVLMFSLAAGSVLSAEADKASKQKEVQKATQASLQKFYEAKPELKGMVAKAPGYAIFTTYGLSFFIGGAGGKGLVHNNKTGKDVFMHMAQASAGLQVGLAESETLIIFKTAQAMSQFIDKGWEYGGGGAAQAGAGGASVGTATGENVIAEALYFTLTKNGLQAGIALAGTKFWKDGDLN